MRALLPTPADAVDLHDHYALAWADSGGVRANMVASVDGAATAAGLSRGLQTPGDNRVFAALRDLADVVLVGAATALAERYRPVTVDEARGALRRSHGFGANLPIALVSRSLHLDLDAPIFADPERRPIVITTGRADPSGLVGVADVLVCGEDQVDFGAARRELTGRGLGRILCEGGPRLLSAVAAAGELDELCLSVTPILAGPASGRIVAGPAPVSPPTRTLQLHGALEEDGALFLRYKVDRAG